MSRSMKSNWRDNVIYVILPTWGFKRKAARYAMEFLSDYKDASTMSPHDKWIPGGRLWEDPIKEAKGAEISCLAAAKSYFTQGTIKETRRDAYSWPSTLERSKRTGP